MLRRSMTRARISLPVCTAVALLVVIAPALAQTTGAGIDLRLTHGTSVLARRGESAGGGGDRVRLVFGDGRVCDGRLGAFGETRILTEGVLESGLAAAVASCRPAYPSGATPVLAIVRPPSMSAWPEPHGATGVRALSAIHAAERAATTAGHLRGAITWETPRVSQLGDAIYALVRGPACATPGPASTCAPRVAAVARVVGAGPEEVLIVRPAHPLWSRQEVAESWFDWGGVVDVDGDGVIELVETQIGPSVRMVRLVRPSDRPEGEIVWLAHHEGDPFDASVDRAPRPVHAH
jgi:hypothetical protein